MAFPAVAARATTTTASGTSHTVNLPSGIASGDVLLLNMKATVDTTVTLPAGWEVLSKTYNGLNGGKMLVTASKLADGTEGSTISVTLGAASVLEAVVQRVTSGKYPPIAGTPATVGAISTANPNPPSVTAPTGGTRDDLVVAVAVTGGPDLTAAPTDYTDLTRPASNDLATAERQVAGVTHDPASFTAASAGWIANTIIIRGVLPGDAESLCSPGTGANDTSVGTVAWANPGNILSSNDTKATSGALSQNVVTNYLRASNMGFAIPTGATILGVKVEIEKLVASGAQLRDNAVRLVKADGTTSAQNKADTTTDWPTSDTYVAYGSAWDLWGETWTPADINDVDFGAVLAATYAGIVGTRTPSVDHMRITVYYEAPSHLAMMV